jgi:hypothetical protein
MIDSLKLHATASRSSLQPLDSILWAVGFIGHLVLLFVLVARRRMRDFPVFASLIGYKILTSILLFSFWRYGSAHAYYLGHWILSPGDYAFQIAIIFEMARHVLRPTGTWVQDPRTDFLLWSASSIVIAATLSLAITPLKRRGSISGRFGPPYSLPY